MSNFIKQSSRKTVLNKKKLGKILEPNHNGKNFSLIATGRELGLDLDDSTLFKNKETDTEAMLLPIGHSHNDEPDIWDVRINLEMKDLFINHLKNQ